MEKIDWEEIRQQFETEMASKLQDLPDHRKVPENLRDFRHLISHELPETAPTKTFKELISLLLKGKRVDLSKIKNKYLKYEIEKEEQMLNKFKNELKELKKSALAWVKTNLPEEDLKNLWKEHKTWLPRRYTIYKKKKVFLQKIVADTLARYALIKILETRSDLIGGRTSSKSIRP